MSSPVSTSTGTSWTVSLVDGLERVDQAQREVRARSDHCR
jgi:hypothetical protein